MNEGFKIEWIETAKLRPAEYNPRKDLKPGDPEYVQIQKSINEFGLVDPLVVNSDMTVIGGHQRLKVLMEAGFDKVPCSIVSLDKTKEKALNIALNKISGEWDFPKLKDLIVELDTGGFDLDAVGWTPKELDDVFSKLGGWRETKEDEFDVDEAIESIKEPVSKRGDIWLCGRHRIMCGDSTSAEDVGKLMDGKKADMVFTDPPYGVEYGKKNRLLNSFQKAGRNLRDVANDMLGKDELLDFLVKAFTLGREHGEDHCSYYVTAPQGGELGLMMMMMMMSGLPTRHVLIWNKNKQNFSLGRLDYEYKHEPILFTWKNTHIFYGAGEHKNSVWDIDKENKCDKHPTMKPVPLITNAILNSSKSEDVCWDLFLGSGSTLIAAEQTNRICYGMEIEPLYVDVSVKRWEEYTGEKAVLSGKDD